MEKASNDNSLEYEQSGRTVSNSNTDEVEKKRYSRAQWIALTTLIFNSFCNGACISLQAPFFPREAEKKGATPTEYGLIFGAFELTVFVTSPIMAKLVAHVPPKIIMNTSLFIAGSMSISFGLLDYVMDRGTFIGLAFATRIIEAMASAGAQIAGNVIIAALFPHNIASTFSFLETSLGIGLIVGPTFGGALFDAGGYGLPFYVMGAMMILNAVIIFFVLPVPEQTESKKGGNWLKFWLHPATVVYALVVFSSFNFIGYCTATLEPHLRQFHLAGVYVGLIFSLNGILYAITTPFWGWLCDKKVDAKLICIIGCVLSVISLLLIGPMPFLHLKSSVGIVASSIAILGASLGAKLVTAFYGALKDATARGFPSDFSTTGLVSAMFASSQSLGAFSGPSLGGYLLEKVGYDTGTTVVFAFEVIVLFLLSAYTITSRSLQRRKNNAEDCETQPLINDRNSATYGCETKHPIEQKEKLNTDCKITVEHLAAD